MAFARFRGSATRSNGRAALLMICAAAVLALSAFATAVGQTTAVKKYDYPAARVSDTVDDYHGTKVADPYRWLEDPASDETVKWVDAQNKLTQAFIDGFPARAGIEERLTKLWNYPRYSLPYKEGDRYFFYKNDGLQNQSVLYMQKTLTAEPILVVDPNTWSADGTVALSTTAYSKDGKIIAYGVSEKGSDWQKIKIRGIDAGKDYDDLLENCRFASLAWKHDNTGFYYDRYPAEGTVPEEDRNSYNRVYWHALGTPQSADVLVYEDPAHKEWGFAPSISDDGKYLMLYVYHGTDPRNGIYYREVDSKGEFVKLFPLEEAKYTPIDNIGTVVYMHTDLDAPKGRIVAFDLSKPDRANWREVIPQGDDPISYASMINNQLVVVFMKDARNVAKVHDTNGKFDREIELPTIGSIAGISGKRKDAEMFFGFTSFTYPSTQFRYDFKKKEVSVFRRPEIQFDGSGYETQQVFYKSKDGTRVPMFITHRKGIQLDGSNPTILYGYGGFNQSMTPYFSVVNLLWFENGGIFAVANIRGGDEYGEDWHQGGILERKQNVFDDFIAAAEWLIANKYTSTPKLAIEGGSNGGLLTAACMLQRPDLFGAIISQVPVTDMLRYHKFTVGRYWASDYGTSDDPAQFEFLYAYSPVHNVKKGVVYPPTFITTADTDDRVVPMHGKKFAAALQAADAGDNPILVRIETKAGHGGGKPTSKRIEEAADTYAFLFRVFGMNLAAK